MGKRTQHVVPNRTGGWSVRASGASRATKSFDTQAAAIKHAKRLAMNERTELYIHGRDGTIKEKNSYGKDTHQP